MYFDISVGDVRCLAKLPQLVFRLLDVEFHYDTEVVYMNAFYINWEHPEGFELAVYIEDGIDSLHLYDYCVVCRVLWKVYAGVANLNEAEVDRLDIHVPYVKVRVLLVVNLIRLIVAHFTRDDRQHREHVVKRLYAE